VFAVLWAFELLMINVVFRLVGGVEQHLGHFSNVWPMPGNLIAVIGLVISVGMVFVAGFLRDRPLLLLDLGLVFEVATAFLAGLLNQWQPLPMPGSISWICVIILLYPMIAPTTPGKTFIAAFAAASMDPVGYGIALMRGVELPATAYQVVWTFVPNYVCAVLAAISAHIIVGLGRHVKKARELGSYTLGGLVSRGGMGEVHSATHRMLARPAAIKLIRPEVLRGSTFDSAHVIQERFRREAQAAAGLRSPHTIELYDFGVADDGTFYYVMELLDGLDLESLVERFGPIPSERAVHLLRQTCLSLGEAHAVDLVHRDIKPSNIHVSRLGLTVDFIKVLDFGLVKGIGQQHDTALTAPQMTTGTPAYMAPEIALGEKPDQRADIYSLGCVAYWLVTGQLVFDAPSPLALMHRHIQDVPDPPSQRTELDVPRELDELILACLAKRREDRPSDGEELGQLLAGLRLHEQWTEERARRWWETNHPTRQIGEPAEEKILAPALASD
jgi:serine/threonine-protein kinase